jgi:hypothetical protein
MSGEIKPSLDADVTEGKQDKDFIHPNPEGLEYPETPSEESATPVHGLESKESELTFDGIFNRIPGGVTKKNLDQPKAPYHCAKHGDDVYIYDPGPKSRLLVRLNNKTKEAKEDIRYTIGKTTLERIDYFLRTRLGL